MKPLSDRSANRVDTVLAFLLLLATPVVATETGTATGPGDSRDGYQDPHFQTRSRSLAGITGTHADLVALAESPPLGLPAVPVPTGNPITESAVQLGRKLFFDRRLSPNNTMSCA
ncbi:MAG: cytochrome c peroxidase, partial [Gammaproteobacteria bacterium]